jgi:hypothetical protein
MTGSEIAFLIIGGVGFLLLLVSLLAGDFGSDHDIDIGDASHDGIDASEGPSWFGVKPICAGLVGLGAVGFSASYLGVPAIFAWILAILGGVGVAAIARQCVLVPLSRMQGNSTISHGSFVGKQAVVITAIPSSMTAGYGEVRFTDENGATVYRAATSTSDSIPTGKRVLIVDVASHGVIVEPNPLSERI